MNTHLLLCAICALAIGCAAEPSAHVCADPPREVVVHASASIVPKPAAPSAQPRLVRSETPAPALAGPAAAPADALLASLATLTPDTREALLAQRAMLKRQRGNRTYRIGGRTLTKHDFVRVIDDLLSGRYLIDAPGAQAVAPRADVRFTGYYSPEVDVSRRRTKTYRYPILAYPKAHEGPLPSRRDIELADSLDAKRLAIAWAKHPLDVYTLQLQGSGFVRFRDGQRRYLAYGGTNRYPYQSIELAAARLDSTLTDLSLRGLRDWIDADPRRRDTITTLNPNYGFFRLAEGRARGAVGVSLTPMMSVAADPLYYPLGSVLLARVPDPSAPGSFTTRLLLVQDTGGAVKGPAHLDLYTGVGEPALDLAEVLNATGQVYLLSPR